MFSLLLSVCLPISFSLPPPLHSSSIRRLVNRCCLSTCHRAGSMHKDGEFELISVFMERGREIPLNHGLVVSKYGKSVCKQG